MERRIAEVIAIVALFIGVHELHAVLYRLIWSESVGWWGGLLYYALWIPPVVIGCWLLKPPALVSQRSAWTRSNVAVLVIVMVGVDAMYGFSMFSVVTGQRALHVPVAWQYLVNAMVAAPVVEELLFRGLLWEALEQRASTLGALVITSLLFGPWHWTSYLAPAWTGVGGTFVGYHVAFGVAMGLLRWRFRSIGPGIVVHGLWNALIPLTG